eukprot:CAMPEP_0119561560 /NCGR_PEP_ID=MMETSP1352-20130426/17988_1 /TAXON_ID=265584 /ORGANISM="Stauroneis constricta, Strain CCMP1120" /LENGTH=99 /DNA_ID=CAMNT_0007609787 /DNA_START=173 /DNA_END=469 /DNA_ORIENTATION=+
MTSTIPSSSSLGRDSNTSLLHVSDGNNANDNVNSNTATTRRPVHPLPPSALQIYGTALWHAKATNTELSKRQLAYAMGYPDGWQVERRIEVADGSCNTD